MTSIVADVLQCTGKLAKENIALKVDDLKRKLEDINLDVQESLKSRYIDFIPQYIKLDKLIDNINSIFNEYEILDYQIEKEIKPQMVSSVVELNDVVEDLKRISQLHKVALGLSLLHQSLESAKSSLNEGFYSNAAQHFVEFDSCSEGMELENKKEIAIMCALRTEFIVTREDMIYRLENAFQEKITISKSFEGKTKTVSIKISNMACREDYSEMLVALHRLEQLQPMLKEFGKKFLSMVCETALLKTVTVNRSSDRQTLSMNILKDHQPQPNEAFEILRKIFIFLNENFFELSVTKSKDTHSAMSELGIAIGDEFSSLVIEKSLKQTIPMQSKQLQNFRDQICAAERFCSFLQHSKFLSYSENKLLSFIYDIDTLPVDKMAQDFLSRGRTLMQKSLHQTVYVGDETPVLSETLNMTSLNEVAGTHNALSKSTFLFPKCQISKSVKDLAQLLYDIKDEAKNFIPLNAQRLYYATRSICELYCCVVPFYHKEEITDIPQQTAIYHNNCMYLAHQVCPLGILYENEVFLTARTTFIDLVSEIRKLGCEAFLAQMRQQKSRLLELLQEEEECSSILIDNGAVTQAEKAIRQCLCHLQLLKKVWVDILPIEVYLKAIGTLFNTCLEEIILRTSSMEDIAADAAAQLDSIFAILLRQGPDLFKAPSIDKSNSVHLYVRHWFKFQELQLILSASMREIVDRWASGKGPLATHFTSEEVKHLVRALFQNTERRAAALAKIR